MKIKCTKNSVSLGTDWFIVGVCLLGALWMWKWHLDGKMPSWRRTPDYWIMALLFMAAAVMVSQSFRIDSEGIVVSYLCIPVRKIYWNQISQVVVAPYRSKKQKQKALVFVLKNGPVFTKEDTAYHFNRTNHHASYMILFPNERTAEIAAAINRIVEKHEHIAPLEIS